MRKVELLPLNMYPFTLDIVKMRKFYDNFRVATVREKYLENEIFSRSGKSQGILWIAREIWKGHGKSGKSQRI